MDLPGTQLKVGDVFQERYEIVSVLGRGGMGTVYLAADRKLKGKRWAIKETWRSPEEYGHFVREAEMLIRLSHPQLPNIVDFYGPDERGFTYLVMDYIRGRTLEQYFAENGRHLSFPRMLKYAIQLCSLFAYLHAQKPEPIIYRDLKPGNVIIDEQDQVRLIDFGIARSHKTGKPSDTVPIGTIGFAAPEQFQQLQTDERTDLYTLGAMMYYLLSGGHYYYGSQLPLSHYRDDLPDPFVAVVSKLLKHRPEERYQSAIQLRHDLELLQHSLQTSSVPAGMAETAGTHIANKLIVIGSLYPGAGSTFIGMTLARVLSGVGIPNAYVENPGNEPDLYNLLFGDRHAPRSYRFLCELIQTDIGGIERERWQSGLTEWVPLPPEGWDQPWNLENSLKLLQAVKQPVVIYDISTRWTDAHAIELCRMADEIVVVTDTSPSKGYRPSSLRTARHFSELRQTGKRIHLVANRDVPLKDRKQWMSSMFMPPVCAFPALDHKLVAEAEWKGALLQDRKEFRELVFKSLSPLLAKLMPDYPWHAVSSSARPALWKKWKEKWM